jgi:signal transduction histidine kinase
MNRPAHEPTRLDVLVHELRSPVAALVALAEAAAAGGAGLTPDQRRRLVTLAVAAGRNVERLLADPELFSIRAERVPLEDLLDGFDGAAVTCPAGLAVRGDPVRLRQALDNLVANARRHGDHVTVTADTAAGQVRIAVGDDGPGLPPGLDVFAPGASGAGSTGLGLYVARAIVAAHGGTIEVESAPDRGATFTLVLPSASSEG